MTRKLKQIGQMKPSNSSSRFIIPVPHKFYKNKASRFDDIVKNNWTIIIKNSSRNLGALYSDTIRKIKCLFR